MPKKLGKAHVTENTIRVKVSGRACAPGSQRHVKFSETPKGIDGMVCCPKGQFKNDRCQVGMITKTIVYDKNKWTKTQAEKHAQKRFLKT